MDPLKGSRWSAAEMVAGFSQSPPNARLVDFAREEFQRRGSLRALDIGCGAGRNAIPLARLGIEVFGTDLSWPMIVAARDRASAEELSGRARFALAAMDAVPAQDRSVDLVIAHGIWNLARSAAEFRRAVADAARTARPGAALFVFTFSRNTLAPDAAPIAGEAFVFTQFSGEPQCFVTEEQLVSELEVAGFMRDRTRPIVEHNRPRAGAIAQASRTPVIYEGVFRLER